jgi:hypothetical protein
MKIGDYVLYDDMVWIVWMKHARDTYQIKTLEPLKTWIDNLEVVPEDVEVLDKSVADVMRSMYEERLGS